MIDVANKNYRTNKPNHKATIRGFAMVLIMVLGGLSLAIADLFGKSHANHSVEQSQ